MTRGRVTAEVARAVIRDSLRATGVELTPESVALAASGGALRYSAPPDDPEDAAWYAAYREVLEAARRGEV